jgi:hypothetical protein
LVAACPRFSFAVGDGYASGVDHFQIFVAGAQAVDRVSGTLVLFDEVVLDAGFGSGAKDRGEVDYAGA